jgi:hypothetical protein
VVEVAVKLRVRAEIGGGELERPRGAGIVIGGVVPLALIVGMRIASLEQTVGDYTISEIAHCFDMMCVEAVVIALFVRRRGGSAVDRCALIVLVGMALLLPILTIFTSHTDLVQHVVLVWHFLLGGWLTAFAIAGAIIQRVRRALPDVRPPLPRPRGWQIPLAGIALLAIGAAYETVVVAADPREVFRHAVPEHAWSYPTHAVYVAVAIVVAETAYAGIALAARGRITLGVRVALLAGVALCGAFASAATPAPIEEVLALWHLFVMLWLLACAAAMIVIAFARIVIERYRRPF